MPVELVPQGSRDRARTAVPDRFSVDQHHRLDDLARRRHERLPGRFRLDRSFHERAIIVVLPVARGAEHRAAVTELRARRRVDTAPSVASSCAAVLMILSRR